MMNGRIRDDHDAGGGHALLRIGASCMAVRAFWVAEAGRFWCVQAEDFASL